VYCYRDPGEKCIIKNYSTSKGGNSPEDKKRTRITVILARGKKKNKGRDNSRSGFRKDRKKVPKPSKIWESLMSRSEARRDRATTEMSSQKRGKGNKRGEGHFKKNNQRSLCRKAHHATRRREVPLNKGYEEMNVHHNRSCGKEKEEWNFWILPSDNPTKRWRTRGTISIS